MTLPGPAAPKRPGWLRRPAKLRLSTLLTAAAIVVLAVVAISVLTANGPGRQPPQAATPFTLGSVGDPARLISLSDYSGRPVVINFFGSWCNVCQRETPLLARFYRAHHGQILIIGVDGRDRTGSALKFMRAKGVSYPVVADPNFALTDAYGAQAGYPQTFFLNARHQIVRHILGAVTAAELNSWAASLARHPGTGGTAANAHGTG